jgi:hypothetical protein
MDKDAQLRSAEIINKRRSGIQLSLDMLDRHFDKGVLATLVSEVRNRYADYIHRADEHGTLRRDKILMHVDPAERLILRGVL